MTFQIRDATTDDVPVLARLHLERFNETHRGGKIRTVVDSSRAVPIGGEGRCRITDLLKAT